MMKFKCSNCSNVMTSITLLNRYNKEENSVKCPRCDSSLKLRHFAKEIPLSDIIKERDRIYWILAMCSVPIQVFAYLKIIFLIRGY
jgi:DNA-directed RNA polymerase subunit RPC12/RpoP